MNFVSLNVAPHDFVICMFINSIAKVMTWQIYDFMKLQVMIPQKLIFF